MQIGDKDEFDDENINEDNDDDNNDNDIANDERTDNTQHQALTQHNPDTPIGGSIPAVEMN
eukprot:CAMPEP_0114676384 /NCGR_PEP_ID=MMETSP0191-20121206/49160_1 /TAXON_ID=126664 /ORGANISM="Sorites sp." /LENGTH=60 /DNA_ID=CAMNT_0001947285 /DNA_START=386 /DNA_END=568 /DNA_ORIENTATION=+